MLAPVRMIEPRWDCGCLRVAQVWLKDITRDFKEMNTAWNEWVGKSDKPVRATVEAKLATPAMLVEIQVTAGAR